MFEVVLRPWVTHGTNCPKKKGNKEKKSGPCLDCPLSTGSVAGLPQSVALVPSGHHLLLLLPPPLVAFALIPGGTFGITTRFPRLPGGPPCKRHDVLPCRELGPSLAVSGRPKPSRMRQATPHEAHGEGHGRALSRIRGPWRGLACLACLTCLTCCLAQGPSNPYHHRDCLLWGPMGVSPESGEAVLGLSAGEKRREGGL